MSTVRPLTTMVLEPCSIEYMLAHAMRSEQVFNIAREWLEPAYFNQPGETVYRMVWAAAAGLYHRYNCLPTREGLAATVVSQLMASQDADQSMIDEAVSFIDWAFPPQYPDDQLVPVHAIDLLKSFLIERKVAASLHTAFRTGMPDDNAMVPALVEAAYQQVQQLSSIQSYTRGYQIPLEWESVAVPTIPTGVQLIDDRMNGGTEPREVHVLLGPTGVGKTTLGMQIVCSMARRNHTAIVEHAPNAERKLHVFISYEDGQRSMVVRSLAFSATIDKTRLEQMNSYNELSRRGNLLPYELQRYGRHPDPPGEYERMCEARVVK